MSLPYFQFIEFSIGFFTVKVWGLFVALGILVSYLLVKKLLKHERPVIADAVLALVVKTVIAGFIGARLGHVLFYNPAFYFENPAEIIAVWHGGLSSFGGFAGAAGALYFFYRAYGAGIFARAADVMAVAFPWGWAIGRLGCFMIHDHPGAPCPGCLLALRYPDGSVRPDLGLYDALLAFALGLLMLFLYKKKCFAHSGVLPVILMAAYAVPRFFFDFLRATDVIGADVRYAGLTPAQYASIGIFVIAYLFLRRFMKKESGT